MPKSNLGKIWYACYGSNLREERFMCYISGGTPAGAHKNFTGCADKTAPEASAGFVMNREMYFAKESETWDGGGICFLKPEEKPEVETLGRRYLISHSQFTDLVRQELKFEGKLTIDLNELVKTGYYDCMPDGRYGLLLHLGDIDGIPVVTFTSEVFLEEEINAPSEAYLSTIIRGLDEIYDLSEQQIEDYLKTKNGIRDHEIQGELPQLISEAI